MAMETGTTEPSQGSTDGAEMAAVMQAQRQRLHTRGAPTAAERIDRIDRVLDLILSNADELLQALTHDYGHRSSAQSTLSDVIGPVPGIKHTRKHLREWMKPTRYRTGPMGLFGARAWIDWQPLGVVGVISPWNFPVCLTFDPVTQAFAAGNSVMVKLSEFVPETSELMRREIAKRFAPDELWATTGGPEIGAQFAALPLDHILLTGAPGTGRLVQRAAAENLVPVTLELGGKSPVVVSPRADLATVAERVMVGKTMNAGQLCLSPDYVLVPRELRDDLVAQLRAVVARMFPRILDNDDYTAVVNDRHYDRLVGLLDDARAGGAQIVPLADSAEDFRVNPARKIAPTLVLDVTPAMRIMREEIFGPLLPIMTYTSITEAIDHINAGPKPLAAYYFGPDDESRRRFMARTYSGGVTLNDVTLHYTVPGMPFGGVGDSGMGYYHGRSGFETFSHGRGVMDVPKGFSPSSMFAAPYGPAKRRAMAAMVAFERHAVRRRLNRTGSGR